MKFINITPKHFLSGVNKTKDRIFKIEHPNLLNSELYVRHSGIKSDGFYWAEISLYDNIRNESMNFDKKVRTVKQAKDYTQNYIENYYILSKN
jgi:hypothetical protein